MDLVDKLEDSCNKGSQNSSLTILLVVKFIY